MDIRIGQSQKEMTYERKLTRRGVDKKRGRTLILKI